MRGRPFANWEKSDCEEECIIRPVVGKVSTKQRI